MGQACSHGGFEGFLNELSSIMWHVAASCNGDQMKGQCCVHGAESSTSAVQTSSCWWQWWPTVFFCASCSFSTSSQPLWGGISAFRRDQTALCQRLATGLTKHQFLNINPPSEITLCPSACQARMFIWHQWSVYSPGYFIERGVHGLSVHVPALLLCFVPCRLQTITTDQQR